MIPTLFDPAREIAADLDTPVSAFLKLRALDPVFLLESVSGGERVGRYSFIGIGRRHELTLLAEGAIDHRPILHEYSPYLLDQMISVVTASTLVAYSLYATSAETAQRLGTTRLGLTIPFVLYGIFRYLYLVHQKRAGGSPTTLLVTDGPLLACVALWTLAVAVILYTPLGR